MLEYLADCVAKSREVADLRKDLSQKEREVLGLGGSEDDVLDLVVIERDTIEEDFGWGFSTNRSGILKPRNLMSIARQCAAYRVETRWKLA